MPDTHVTKNYFTDGGDTLVVGGKLSFLEGAEVENFPDNNNNDMSFTPAAYQADSEATTVAGLKENFNTLLASFRTAGLMAAAPAQEETPGRQDQGDS